AIIGSLAYMAPEQISNSKDIDSRSDVWSMGVILHELLTGRLPFSGQNDAMLARSIVLHAPPLLRSLRPDAPEAIEKLILNCLQKDRAARSPTVPQIALVLREFATAEAGANQVGGARTYAAGVEEGTRQFAKKRLGIEQLLTASLSISKPRAGP